MAELTKALHEAPENKLARDKEALERMRNDAHHLNRRLTTADARNEEAMLAARIRDAENALATFWLGRNRPGGPGSRMKATSRPDWTGGATRGPDTRRGIPGPVRQHAQNQGA